jgi:molecular chaperone DnaK (HSP70)
MPKPKFIVGIDLGTTNSSLSSIEITNSPILFPVISNHFPIQIIKPFELGPKALLPSFYYQASPNDLPTGCLDLPWHTGEPVPQTTVVGEFAKVQGALVSGRLVHSAKSWLSTQDSDRSGKILPWAGSEEIPRISPVEASAKYLAHLKASWNFSKNGQSALEDQTIVLTIPASFDDIARRLTLEAAKLAGLKKPILLEEPQAVFYSWLSEQGLSNGLSSGMTVVVIDVGGGTTDFSLIETMELNGSIAFSRKAIGDHLLLGGDNMDIALARVVEGKISPGGKLGTSLFQQLIHQCRLAKEQLLSENPSDYYPILLEGRGRSLVGSSISYEISREFVDQFILDGFFPFCQPGQISTVSKRQGMIQAGLPYAQEAAITKHLAAFLSQHGCFSNPPNAYLLNGGAFSSPLLRNRISDFFTQYFPGNKIRPLATQCVNHAVSRGAAYFAWLTQTGAQIIRSNAAKSYYLSLGKSGPDTTSLFCVLPGTAMEEQEFVCDHHEMELTLGTPVRFPLYASTIRLNDKPGSVIEADLTQLHPLPPLQTVLAGGRKTTAKTTQVFLRSKLTSIGTLDLYLFDHHKNQWHLDFNLSPTHPAEKQHSSFDIATSLPESLIETAFGRIKLNFSNPSEPTPSVAGNLTKDLEIILDSSRADWSAATCRRLWPALLSEAEWRRSNPGLLNRWYNLAGWILRPGFGYPQDSFRVEQLWKALHSPAKGNPSLRQPEGGIEFWVLIRRVAGGLTSGKQNAIVDRLKPFLLPTKGKPPFKPATAEISEMWRCSACLERIDLATRVALGETLFRKIKSFPEEALEWQIWCLGRFGNRLPAYGSAASVLPRETVTEWILTLLKWQPKSQTFMQNLGLALGQMGRSVNNPEIEIDPEIKIQISQRLIEMKCPQTIQDMLAGRREQQTSHLEFTLGETLPLGLRLMNSED